MHETSSANSGVPDLTIWDSIRDCATAELARLASTIESEIASDKSLADLQKTGSIKMAMQSRARDWMARAYARCLKCWKENGDGRETPEFVLAIYVYALSPFYSKEMVTLLRLAAGVSRETMSRLESGGVARLADTDALFNASDVWRGMFLTWQMVLPSFETPTRTPGSPELSANSASSRKTVSSAPKPATEVRGTGGLSRSTAKPTEVPTDFPPHFPPTLTLRMRIILSECVKAVPDRSSLDRLCKEIVSKSTELLCAAVRQGILKAHAAPDHLNEVLHYVQVTNCQDDNERYRVQKTVVNSDEWLSMLTRLAECEELEAQTRNQQPENGSANDRKKKIQAFIQTLRGSGHQITKKDIWRAAGYEDATEFERFQRADERTTAASAANFNRVLGMPPEAFIALLKKFDSR